MSKLMEVAEKELVRREILSMCSMAEPEGANTKVLYISLRKSGYDLTDEDVMRQAGYLEGKGLVRITSVENKALNLQRSIVRITPAGTDYLEGNLDGMSGIGEL